MSGRFSYDVKAILTRDPAARNALEVMLCYPSFWANLFHRMANALWRHHLKLLARVLSQFSRFVTGIEIHPGAAIGPGLFIDHGSGVVIGETSVLGRDVTLYQGVTLGGTGKDTGKRHPTLGDRVVVGSGAKILGPFTVGDDAKIGAGAVVLKEVPERCTVVGNPGRIVRRDGQRVDAIDLDHVHMPDPVKEALERLGARIEQLEQCIRRTGEGESCLACENRETMDCPRNERKDDGLAHL